MSSGLDGSTTSLGIVGGLGEALDQAGEMLDSLVDLAVLARRVAGVDAPRG
jgi:hypothetical protein